MSDKDLCLETCTKIPAAVLPSARPGALAGLLGSAGAAMAEETRMRIGVMTILAWPIARLLGHSEVRPKVAWPANVLAALAFGLIHLPQRAQFGTPTLTAVAFVLLGNGVVGVVCGWLHWPRSLIAAHPHSLCRGRGSTVLPAIGT